MDEAPKRYTLEMDRDELEMLYSAMYMSRKFIEKDDQGRFRDLMLRTLGLEKSMALDFYGPTE